MIIGDRILFGSWISGKKVNEPIMIGRVDMTRVANEIQNEYTI